MRTTFTNIVVVMFLLVSFAAGQNINAKTQLMNQVQPANGGTGIDTSTLSGCVKVVSGVYSVSPSNCPSSISAVTSINGNPGAYTFTGSAVTCSGTTCTFAAPAAGITALTGDVTAAGPGSAAATLASVTTAACPNIGGTILCYDVKGRIISTGAPFAVSLACSAAGTFEVGAATTNPNACALSYANGTPTGATVADGTHTVTLSSPYTSASLAYSYCTVAQGIASFTFSATATTTSQSASATNTALCQPRTFVGGGTAGATGATASGTSAVLAGATGTLASAGLGATYTGQQFTLNLSGQEMYLLLTGGSHTFKVNGFTTTFSQISVGFVNVNGATTPLFLYFVPGLLTGTYLVEVTG